MLILLVKEVYHVDIVSEGSVSVLLDELLTHHLYCTITIVKDIAKYTSNIYGKMW